jgi:RNA polymerase sigma-70 factor (ECF subfamily)
MSTLGQNLIIRLSAAAAATLETADRPSELELKVIELFDESRDSLLRYAVSLGLSTSDGEEIIQEVFLALFRHLQLGRDGSNLRGWLFRVAHNLALKQRNANYKLQQKHHPDGEIVDRQLDPTPNPEEQLMHSQRQERLRAVLEALPEQDRCCLNLRAEGLRYREIANILGMSLGAVSISLTRALARLGCADEGYNYAG